MVRNMANTRIGFRMRMLMLADPLSFRQVTHTDVLPVALLPLRLEVRGVKKKVPKWQAEGNTGLVGKARTQVVARGLRG